MSDNPFDTMRAAVEQARRVMRAADTCVEAVAHLMIGRLRRIPHQHLVALKRELREFDAQQKRWKS